MSIMSYECRHIMPSGAKCQAVALKGKPYCYAHTRLHRFKAEPPIGPTGNLRLPVLEDRSAIQVALAMLVDALCSSRIDARRAGLLLYAIQIGSQNVDRKCDIIPSQTVETMTETGTGEELGPEKVICDPDNCAACPDRATCEDYELGDDEEEEAQSTPLTVRTIHGSVPTAHRSVPTDQCTPPTAHCSLSTVHCALHTAHCALHTDNC